VWVVRAVRFEKLDSKVYYPAVFEIPFLSAKERE
jgi:hypothetical protein